MRAAVALAAAVMTAPGLTAQQLATFAETVVVTATGEEQPAGEVDAATTVVTAEQLDRRGSPSVADSLREVPGTVVLRSGLDGGVTSLFVRGANSNQTLVLFDGVRLNSPFFGGYDWSLPLAAGLTRVEVVRGPFSALWGADALGGVVQVVPSRAGGNGARLLAEAGADGWRRAEASASVTAGRFGLAATAATRTGSGSLANDDFSARTVMTNATWSAGERSRLGLLLRTTSSRSEVPFVGATPTPTRLTRAEETLVAMPLRFVVGPVSDLEIILSHVTRDLAFRDPADSWGFVASDTEADSDGLRFALHHGEAAHRLTVGGEWRRDAVSDRSNLGVNLDGREISTTSAFLQDRVDLWARAGLLVGVRWDRADPWGSEISPRVTLSWRASSWRAWTSWGHAFRAPGLGELYYPFAGNPSLEPERSNASEIGLIVMPEGHGTSLQLVAFHSRVHNLIDFDYASYRYANVLAALQQGLEGAWALRVAATTELRVAATWLETSDEEGRALLRRPTWSGSATVSTTLGKAVDAELAIIWVGPRHDLDPVTLTRVEAAGFLTAALSARVPVRNLFAVRLRLENLADRSYAEVLGYPAPRRRAMVGIETVIE